MDAEQAKLQPAPAPIPDSYWVLPGKLLAGEYPGAKKEAEARVKLRLFREAGVSFFLDLTEAGELAPYAQLLDEAGGGGASGGEAGGPAGERAAHPPTVHCRRPIPDLGTPSPEQVRRILDTVDAALSEGHCVYIHCWGGIGRTGTVVGCFMVRHGMFGPQALAEIERLRAGTPDGWKRSPETPEQRERVRSWLPGA
jgi:hypothetical protein